MMACMKLYEKCDIEINGGFTVRENVQFLSSARGGVELLWNDI